MNPATRTLIEAVSDTLRAQLGDDYDAETFWDTLDGETDILDLLKRLIIEDRERRAAEDACKAMAMTYQDRAKRHAAASRAAREGMRALLAAAGERKIAHPLGTVYLQAGAEAVNIYDLEAIPSQLHRVRSEPDLSEIKRQLKAGEFVPGAELTRGPESVRVK